MGSRALKLPNRALQLSRVVGGRVVGDCGQNFGEFLAKKSGCVQHFARVGILWTDLIQEAVDTINR